MHSGRRKPDDDLLPPDDHLRERWRTNDDESAIGGCCSCGAKAHALNHKRLYREERLAAR